MFVQEAKSLQSQISPIRKNYKIEQHEGLYVAYNSSVGAFSVLDDFELVGFEIYIENTQNVDRIVNWYENFTDGDVQYAEFLAEQLVNKLKNEGWERNSLPPDNAVPLTSVYFTLTRECDLACPYCYQGLRNRKKKEMTLDEAKNIIKKIIEFNKDCHVIVTGGEPMYHPDFFAIMDQLEANNLSFGILSNGTFITEETAAKLSTYKNLKRFQFSLDGIDEQTHALTRTKSNFHKVLQGLELMAKHKVPFLVAPTIHEANKEQIKNIAELAVSKGGWISPNNLMKFPHDENKNLSLDNLSYQKVLSELNEHLLLTFGREKLAQIQESVAVKNVCSATTPNSTFICGTGWALLDIDWNGEIYPCHLLKERDMILGNINEIGFAEIFANSIKKKARVFSYEIDKCSSCKFISKCGGGCRAGAFYHYGTMVHEDNLCDVNYEMNLKMAINAHPSNTNGGD